MRQEGYFILIKKFSVLGKNSPYFCVVGFCEGLDGVVDGPLPGGAADIDLHEIGGPLLDHELHAIGAAGRGRASRQEQPLNVPRGQTDEARVGDMLAPTDVQHLELVGPLEDALNLGVVQSLKISSAIHGDMQFFQIWESRRVNLLLNWSFGQTDHGVVGVEDAQFRATLLELLNIDEDRIAGGRRDVGNVQLFQIATMRLKKRKKNGKTLSLLDLKMTFYRESLENERETGHFVARDVEVTQPTSKGGDEVGQASTRHSTPRAARR